ncbi:hypothetical protein RhiirB3_436759 [Rhizophagus irregularis]|nr:hypothetical protein RhiirB3_436759 [Rhizophagus irregularis]
MALQQYIQQYGRMVHYIIIRKMKVIQIKLLRYYILVQNTFINLVNWFSGNEKIDKFIQEIQSQIKDHNDIFFECILYSQFNNIKKIGIQKDIANFSCLISISDMGLCGEVDNIDKTKIYGVMSYVAPEALREKDYTQAADIYSLI